MSAMRTETADIYELRKPGEAGVRSSIPFCGYEPSQLRSLMKAGYKPYRNGKRIDPPKPTKEG